MSKVPSRPVNKSRTCASASADRVRVACNRGACDTGLPACERRLPPSGEYNARCAPSVIKQQNDTRFGCGISRGNAAIRATWSSAARLSCEFSTDSHHDRILARASGSGYLLRDCDCFKAEIRSSASELLHCACDYFWGATRSAGSGSLQ